MQKIMVCLAAKEGLLAPNAESIEGLLEEYTGLFQYAAYALADDSVLDAQALKIINSNHPSSIVVSFWCKHPKQLNDFWEALADYAYQAYAVVEQEAISHEAKIGRTPGMCQIAFLQQPERLSREEWLQNWLGDHTQVAIETQSNFAYRQNVVAYALKGNGEWPLLDAIVEECFPDAAMTSRQAFFDAEGDEERYKANEQAMINSCMRFIDFDRFDCLPMAEYVLKVHR